MLPTENANNGAQPGIWPAVLRMFRATIDVRDIPVFFAGSPEDTLTGGQIRSTVFSAPRNCCSPWLFAAIQLVSAPDLRQEGGCQNSILLPFHLLSPENKQVSDVADDL